MPPAGFNDAPTAPFSAGLFFSVHVHVHVNVNVHVNGPKTRCPSGIALRKISAGSRPGRERLDSVEKSVHFHRARIRVHVHGKTAKQRQRTTAIATAAGRRATIADTIRSHKDRGRHECRQSGGCRKPHVAGAVSNRDRGSWTSGRFQRIPDSPVFRWVVLFRSRARARENSGAQRHQHSMFDVGR